MAAPQDSPSEPLSVGRRQRPVAESRPVTYLVLVARAGKLGSRTYYMKDEVLME